MKNMYLERDNIKRYKEFKTCEGDSIFLIGNWRPLHEVTIYNENSLFEFAETYEDGLSDTRDSERKLRYFIYKGMRWPLTEFGISGTDYDVQVISFIVKKMSGGRKAKREIHFINGYCMSPGMNWMLIEIKDGRVRVFECNPKSPW